MHLYNVVEAKKNSEVAQIIMEQKIQEKESQKRIQAIEDQASLDRRKLQADSQYYELERLALANKVCFILYQLLLTQNYLEKLRIDAIANMNKVYYGNRIPNIFIQEGELASKLNDTHR